MENKPFECWAVVELMGHQRIAGHIAEKTFGPTVMLQVNVPAVNNSPEYTRIFNFSAVYAINPCSEEVARRAAASIYGIAVVDYDMQRHLQELLKAQSPALTPGIEPEESEDENNDQNQNW